MKGRSRERASSLSIILCFLFLISKRIMKQMAYLMAVIFPNVFCGVIFFVPFSHEKTLALKWKWGHTKMHSILKGFFLRKWSLRNSLGSKLKGYFTSLRTFKSFFVQEKSGILSRKLCQCNWPEIYGMKKSWHFCKKISLRKCVKKTRQVRWPKDIKEKKRF